MTRQTLLRYEWQGIIPKSERGSKGRGQGRWTEYPVETIPQAFAAWTLIHGAYATNIGEAGAGQIFFGKPPKLPPHVVAVVRKTYLESYEFIKNAHNEIEKLQAKIKGLAKDVRNDVASDMAEFMIQMAKGMAQASLLQDDEREDQMRKLDADAREKASEIVSSNYLEYMDAMIKERELLEKIRRNGIDSNLIKQSLEMNTPDISECEKDALLYLTQAYCEIYQMQILKGEALLSYLNEDK